MEIRHRNGEKGTEILSSREAAPQRAGLSGEDLRSSTSKPYFLRVKRNSLFCCYFSKVVAQAKASSGLEFFLLSYEKVILADLFTSKDWLILLQIGIPGKAKGHLGIFKIISYLDFNESAGGQTSLYA